LKSAHPPIARRIRRMMPTIIPIMVGVGMPTRAVLLCAPASVLELGFPVMDMSDTGLPAGETGGTAGVGSGFAGELGEFPEFPEFEEFEEFGDSGEFGESGD
jgi:hypothetical protein